MGDWRDSTPDDSSANAFKRAADQFLAGHDGYGKRDRYPSAIQRRVAHSNSLEDAGQAEMQAEQRIFIQTHRANTNIDRILHSDQ
jgi:hypothetical protein